MGTVPLGLDVQGTVLALVFPHKVHIFLAAELGGRGFEGQGCRVKGGGWRVKGAGCRV